MKKWLVLGVFVLMGSVLFAQGNYQDVVHLKNGSVIRGTIVEEVPNQSITIATPDGSVMVCQMAEIEKITKVQKVGSHDIYSVGGRVGGIDNSFLNNAGTGLKCGSKVLFENGYLGRTGNYGMDRVKLNFIAGYQVNPYFSFGFGAGVRYYTDDYWEDRSVFRETALAPLFSGFRVNFMNRKVSPYLAFDLGYSYDIGDEHWAGALASQTLGVSVKLSDRLALNIGLEYEAQGVKFRYYNRSEISGALGITVSLLLMED
jgi:hypothetical protein